MHIHNTHIDDFVVLLLLFPDVGRWNPNGTLSIIDRKKNMLKLSQGEYIALEKVEGCYKNLMTAQVWVYGNSYHSFLVAVVVPDTANCLTWLQSKGFSLFFFRCFLVFIFSLSKKWCAIFTSERVMSMD